MTPESATPPEHTILIVDDSPDNLRVLSKTLSAYGYAVRCVTNGSMAFVSIQNSPPDLILLDIRMPGMNGYDVCQRLKQTPDTQDIPVIFLSALDDVKDIVKAFQVGGVDYITKPFQTEEVLARIRNQLIIQNLRKQLSEQNQHLLQEIEERKNFEQALCQEIQRRILVEASLQDAKNAAEAANYAKSEFLAQMSHELRTPLNIILGFTTLMQGDASLAPTHQDYLATIDESAQRLLKLINRVLSITRAESSQLSLEEQEFDLHHLLEAVVSLWQPKALEKRLRFEFHRSPNVPQQVQSDESKLRQILMNLLENAIEMTAQGSITLKIDVDNQGSLSDRTCRLVIEVQDTRTGVGLNDGDNVFPRLSQPNLEPKLTQNLELGRLLIRQFAQLMGGNVTFKSQAVGSLTTVHLVVRLADPLLTAAPFYEPSSAYMMQSAPDEGTLTIEALQIAMSDDWLMQLNQAAVKGFDQEILYLLKKIPSHYAAIAKTLEMWTYNFQFDRIIEVTQHGAQ